MRLTRRDRQDAAVALVALLRVVEAGELTADSPQEKRMLRRIEGAVAVLNGADGVGDRTGS